MGNATLHPTLPTQPLHPDVVIPRRFYLLFFFLFSFSSSKAKEDWNTARNMPNAMSLIIRGVAEDVWGGFVWKTCVEVGFLKERG